MFVTTKINYKIPESWFGDYLRQCVCYVFFFNIRSILTHPVITLEQRKETENRVSLHIDIVRDFF